MEDQLVAVLGVFFTGVPNVELHADVVQVTRGQKDIDLVRLEAMLGALQNTGQDVEIPFDLPDVGRSVGRILGEALLLPDPSRRTADLAHFPGKGFIFLRRDPSHQGQVYHSLGNLLARDRGRWKQAEDAYRKSLELRRDPSHQGQVYHSLGNLLAQDDERWAEAKVAFEESIALWAAAEHQAQVLASWASALGKRFAKYHRAEDALEAEARALKSRKLTKKPYTRSIDSRVLGEIYEKQGLFDKALDAYEDLLAMDLKQKKHTFAQKTRQKIVELRRRL